MVIGTTDTLSLHYKSGCKFKSSNGRRVCCWNPGPRYGSKSYRTKRGHQQVSPASLAFHTFRVLHIQCHATTAHAYIGTGSVISPFCVPCTRLNSLRGEDTAEARTAEGTVTAAKRHRRSQRVLEQRGKRKTAEACSRQ